MATLMNHRSLAAPTSRLRIRFFHDVLFWASLSASGTDRCSASQSFVMLSVHLFRGLPLGLTPLMWPSSSMWGYLLGFILATWPKYDKRLVLKVSTMSSLIDNSFKMSLLRLWSLLEQPRIFFATDISKTRSDHIFSSLRVRCTAVWTGLEYDKLVLLFLYWCPWPSRFSQDSELLLKQCQFFVRCLCDKWHHYKWYHRYRQTLAPVWLQNNFAYLDMDLYLWRVSHYSLYLGFDETHCQSASVTRGIDLVDYQL